MIAAWPWSALAPLNPMRGLIDFADFDYDDSHPARRPRSTTMADRAALVRAGLSPDQAADRHARRGAGLAMLLAIRARRQRRSPRAARKSRCVAVTVVFPVLVRGDRQGPAFTGLRHFLFVVPPLAVLAGDRIRRPAAARWRNARRDRRLSRRSRRVFGWCLERGTAGRAAPLRIPLLTIRWSADRRRGPPLRHRLLGQHHAGGGRTISRTTCRPARRNRTQRFAALTKSRYAASGSRSRSGLRRATSNSRLQWTR